MRAFELCISALPAQSHLSRFPSWLVYLRPRIRLYGQYSGKLDTCDSAHPDSGAGWHVAIH